jgi:hypothetical protein
MKRFITTLSILLIAAGSYAQQDLTLYNLNEIPQSSYSNPSNRFNGKFFIGLPVISSMYYSFSNSGFAYSDLIRKQGDSLLVDFNNMIKELEDENFTSFNTRVDLFSFGLNLGKRTQLTFNATEVASFKFTYTKDFIRFVYGGNAAFEDNVANFENLGIALNHYREYAVGLSHQLTEKWRVGGKVKYLYGMENIYSKKTDLSLRTDPETFELTAHADLEIRTAGIDDVDIDEEGVSNYLTNRNNKGMGIDLGANYEFSDRLSFNASILDLGYINWKYKTKSYIVDDGEYSYSGIEVSAFTDDENSAQNDDETSFDRVLDSLEEAFDLKEPTDGYKAPLTSRFYLGANYKLNEKTLVGGLIQSEVFKKQLHPSFTASVNRKMTKWITLAASYTLINRSYNNLGVGLNINPGPVQFYLISDNILSAFQPQHARYAQVRFGINLIFGSDKSKEIRPKFVPASKEKKNKKKEEKE